MRDFRVIVFISFTLCCLMVAFFLPPISQDPAYHHFADTRMMFGIPNFYNVVSNIPFLIIGIGGLYIFLKDETISFSSLPGFILFTGVTLVGLGSGYYHWRPTNASLVWDRIPMTITFMSFFAIVVGRYVNKQWGTSVLIPLVAIGVSSVLYWYFGEQQGRGDLRLYALIQFYPMMAIPLIIFLFPTPRLVRLEIIVVIMLYAVAKFFEHNDLTVSGHLASAVIPLSICLRRRLH